MSMTMRSRAHPVQMAMGKLYDAAKAETLADGQIYSSGFVAGEDGSVRLVLAAPVFYLDRFFGAVAFSTDMQKLAALLNESTGIAESEQIFLVDIRRQTGPAGPERRSCGRLFALRTFLPVNA